MLFTSRPTTRWIGRRPLQLVAELLGRQARGRERLDELLVGRDLVLLLEALDLLLDLGVGRDDVQLARPVLEEGLVHQLAQGRLPDLVPPGEVEAGRGLPEGGLGPLVELALRDDAGVDVDEDPVDDLAGRREGREGEGSEEGGAEEASEQRHGAESSEKRAAPPT